MAHFPIPHAFDPETALEVPGFQIVTLRDGVLEPVALVRTTDALPIAAEKLADNCAALWDERNPVHFYGDEHEMRYQPYAGGMDLLFRKKGPDGGVSEIGATMTALPGYEEALSHRMAHTSPTMQLFLKSGWMPEQRAEPRATSDGKGKGHRPSSTPRPGI